jgi:hypothetical protein
LSRSSHGRTRGSRKHTDATPSAPAPSATRRIPVWASLITLAILVSSWVSVEPIRDAATLLPTVDAHLRFPALYLVFAPLSNVLDTITLLAIPQHIALFVFAALLYAVVRVVRAMRAEPMPVLRRVVREVLGAAGFLAAVVVLYAAMAFLPRPMARLEVARPDVLAVDFHFHTEHSHDGRAGFTAAKVRQWARNAGYDAAYITDHATFQGSEDARSANPSVPGDGVVLLQGIEAFYNGEHVNVLGAGRRYRNILTADLKSVDEQVLAMISSIPGVEPVIIETIPGDLSKIVPATGPRTAGMRAVEIVDGSPRGLTQTRRERARINALADSLNLARVTGTDNHGYGFAAPGWTLMRIPEWRGLSVDSLANFIEFDIRVLGRSSTRTIERTIADGSTTLRAALAPVLVPWRMLTTLSAEERVSWVIWAWGVTALVRWIRRRPRDVRPSNHAAPA